MIRRNLLFAFAVLLILFSISCSKVAWSPVLTKTAIESTSEFLSDEYFDELDELFEQIKGEQSKWHMFDSSKKMAAHAVATKMMEDLASNPEALNHNKNFSRFFETFDNKIRKIGRISEEMHYFRNTLNEYSHAPVKLDDMITLAASDEWELFSAKFHRYDFEGLDGAYNVKFISADGRFEAVYNTETGEIVVDPVNMGTYNYAPGSINPVLYYRHHTLDKKPWKKWGNTAEVAYREIAALKSKHGTKAAKNNASTVESLIQERKSGRQNGNR